MPGRYRRCRDRGAMPRRRTQVALLRPAGSPRRGVTSQSESVARRDWHSSYQNSMKVQMRLIVFISALCCCSLGSLNAVTGHSHIVGVYPVLRRTLTLRGGDGQRVVPGVAWSQQADSLLLKVDMPPGVHSTDGLKISDTHISWKEGDAELDLALSAEVKSESASIFCDG